MNEEQKLRVPCPGCKRRYAWLPTLAHKKIRCTCGVKFRMPDTPDGPAVFLDRSDPAFPDLMVAKLRPKSQIGQSTGLPSALSPAQTSSQTGAGIPSPETQTGQQKAAAKKDDEEDSNSNIEIDPLDLNSAGLESSVLPGDLIEAEESDDSDIGMRAPPPPMTFEPTSQLPVAKFNPARRPSPPPKPAKPKGWWQSMLDRMFGK